MSTHAKTAKRSWRRVRTLIAALAIGGPAAWAQPTTYTVSAITMPSGTTFAVAKAINASGQVTGLYVDSSGLEHAFLWSGGTRTDIPALPGYLGMSGAGISTAGVVVGGAFTGASGGFSVAFKFEGGQVIELPRLGNGRYSGAYAISPGGTITGYSYSFGANGQSGYRGFVLNGSTLTALPHWVSRGNANDGEAVNDAGIVVGSTSTDSGFFHPALFDPVEGPLDLGTLGGLYGIAQGVNSSAQVVGYSETGVPPADSAGYLTNHAFLWDRGVMTDLGVLPGMPESYARAINDAGVIVGNGAARDNSAIRAFVWHTGTMSDLNVLIPSGTGWTLQSAYAINAAGQIVGRGTLNGASTPFVLTPAP